MHSKLASKLTNKYYNFIAIDIYQYTYVMYLHTCTTFMYMCAALLLKFFKEVNRSWTNDVVLDK